MKSGQSGEREKICDNISLKHVVTVLSVPLLPKGIKFGGVTSLIPTSREDFQGVMGESEHVSSSLETQRLVPGFFPRKLNMHVAGLQLVGQYINQKNYFIGHSYNSDADSATYRGKNVGVNARFPAVKHGVTNGHLTRDATISGLENSSAKESEKFLKS